LVEHIEYDGDGNSIFYFYNQGANKMNLEQIKKISWNLLGAFIYVCVGVGSVFHIILGY